MSTKPITAEVALVPNYLFHLPAVARAGYDSDYADRYAATVNDDDRRFITDHRELFRFGAGQGGPMCNFALFMPIMLDLDCRGAVDELLRLVIDSLRTGDTEPLFQRYHRRCQHLRDTWFAPDPEQIIACRRQLPVVERYADIVYHNWNRYQSEVWPLECRLIQVVATQINIHFAGCDTVGEWERLTGREFRTPGCKIILCSALKNGPNANSMGYDRIVFWSGQELNWTLDFISHEIGTHLMIDVVRTLQADATVDWQEMYAAYESLCRYLNARVLGREPLYDLKQFHAAAYASLYEKLIPDPLMCDYPRAVKEAVAWRKRTNEKPS